MKSAIIFSAIISCMLLAACEYSYKYSYELRNTADTAVLVHLALRYNKDTSFYLPQNAQFRSIWVDHGVEGRRGPYYRDVINDLDTCTIWLRGHQSRRNYQMDSAWTFGKDGVFSTVITSTEF